jgi:hypothetical protein
MSEEKPKFSRGRKMNIPDGTGFGIVGMMGGERYLMSGPEAQKTENIIKLFEQIKDRKATPGAIANVERKLKAE